MLKRLRHIRAATLQVINNTFARKVHVSLADSHASNILAERAGKHTFAMEGRPPSSPTGKQGWHHMSVRCRMHRIDTCEKRMVELAPGAESGMVNLSLFLLQHGQMEDIRRRMGTIVRTAAPEGRLRITRGRVPDDVKQWRQEMESRFLSSSHGRQINQQLLAWRHLYNGDGRRADVIEHYEVGCCKSVDDTVRKMSGLGVRQLLSRACNWSRKSWLGHAAALDAIAPPGVHAWLV